MTQLGKCPVCKLIGLFFAGDSVACSKAVNSFPQSIGTELSIYLQLES